MTEAASPVNPIVNTCKTQHTMGMVKQRTAHIVFALAAVLAGCGPVTVYHKPDASFAQLDRDVLECQTSALKQAPVANEIRQSPSYFRPGRRICEDGNCYHTSGHWVPGNIYTVDVNRTLRLRLQRSCMRDRGYSEIEARRCPAGTPRPNGDTLGRLVTPTGNECAVPVQNGPRVLQPL